MKCPTAAAVASGSGCGECANTCTVSGCSAIKFETDPGGVGGGAFAPGGALHQAASAVVLPHPLAKTCPSAWYRAITCPLSIVRLIVIGAVADDPTGVEVGGRACPGGRGVGGGGVCAGG